MLCISVRLMAIDNTIVNVALPTLNRRINGSTVTCRTLFFAVCGELAAGANRPARSEVKDFSPGQP